MTELPPDALSLHWCDTCGRHDRVTPFYSAHYANGKKCKGTLHTLKYERITRVDSDNPSSR